jgi:tetratricopeptide (TPR) repeat protein
MIDRGRHRSAFFQGLVLWSVLLGAPASIARESSPNAADERCRVPAATPPSAVAAHPQDIVARHEQALATCDRLIANGGLSGAALADALLRRGDLLAPGTGDGYRRALADYDRAISLRPRDAGGYARRGKAHLLYMRDLPRALRDLDHAISLDPSQAEFLVTRASIHSSLGEPKAALDDLDRAIALAPRLEHAGRYGD